jgi:RNA-binding protein YhbY
MSSISFCYVFSVSTSTKKPTKQPVSFSPDQQKSETKFSVAEKSKDFLEVPWNKEMEKMVTSASDTYKQIESIIKTLRKKRDDLYKKYSEMDGTLDTFLPKIGSEIGEFEEKIDIFEGIVKKEEAQAIKKADLSKKSKTPVERAMQATEYKNEWGNVKKRMEALDTQENALLKKLRAFDGEIDKAADEAVNARKQSVDILQVKDAKEAAESLTKIKACLKKVQDITDDLQKGYVEPFNTSLSKIESEMKYIQAKVEALKKKAHILEPEVSVGDEDVKKKVLEKKKTATPKKPPIKESKLFKKTVNVSAYIVALCKKAGSWCVQGCGKIGDWLDTLFHRKPGSLTHLEFHEKKKAQAAPSKPKWRIVAETLFDQFLDLLTVIFRKIKIYSIRFYNNFLKVKFGHFFSAVKQRAVQLEQEEKTKKNLAEVRDSTMLGSQDIGVPHDLPPATKKNGGKPPTIPADVKS